MNFLSISQNCLIDFAVNKKDNYAAIFSCINQLSMFNRNGKPIRRFKLDLINPFKVLWFDNVWAVFNNSGQLQIQHSQVLDLGITNAEVLDVARENNSLYLLTNTSIQIFEISKIHFKATALLLLSPIVIKAQAPIGLDTLNLIQIGPLIESMPHLDSLVVNKKDSVENKVLHSKKNNLKAFPMNASGFFYRGISVGQYGNNSFNGGLRLQIAGKISEKTQIMGVITDESLPIQPEGSTADLEELDKVYINVSSSLYSLQAGDIETGEARNSLNLYRRKITGISSDIQINNGQIRTVFGQSKEHFIEWKSKVRMAIKDLICLKAKKGGLVLL